MRYFWTAAALIVLCVAASGDAAEASPQARITVGVSNGTANGTTVAGDEVTLQLYKGQEQIDSVSTKVGPDSKAVFENVQAGQDVAAIARVKHKNMVFNSQSVPLTPVSGTLSMSVQVFDVSTDTSKLSIGMHHIMMAVRSASLEFTEYMQMSNSCDMAITVPQRDERNRPIVLEIPLPKGFRNLTASGYLEERALVITQDGFYDTLAVPPGEHQVTFSYKLDIDRGTVSIARKIGLPTSELMVFWEQGQGRLEGLSEPTGRLTNAEGVPVDYYRRANIRPGEEIAFQISGFRVKGSDTFTWIILAVVFAVVAAIALLRPRARSARSGPQYA